jgi:hypothetical protein
MQWHPQIVEQHAQVGSNPGRLLPIISMVDWKVSLTDAAHSVLTPAPSGGVVDGAHDVDAVRLWMDTP